MIDPAAWPTEPADRVRSVLDAILDHLELDAEVEITESDEEIHAAIDGEDDLGLLIGRHGQTIEAIQLLCYRSAFQESPDRKRVAVDAAGYRERRIEALDREADAAAARALDSSQPVYLSSMNASERRAVHARLKDHAGIETYSEGEEPDRSVVVAPLLRD